MNSLWVIIFLHKNEIISLSNDFKYSSLTLIFYSHEVKEFQDLLCNTNTQFDISNFFARY